MTDRVFIENPPPSLLVELDRLMARACQRDGYAIEARIVEVPRGVQYVCKRKYVPMQKGAA